MFYLKTRFLIGIILIGLAVAQQPLETVNVNVHFVTHSHMDAGWLKTYDMYYQNKVSHIFESVFNELQQNPDYKYTLGDIAFFRRYYLELSAD